MAAHQHTVAISQDGTQPNEAGAGNEAGTVN